MNGYAGGVYHTQDTPRSTDQQVPINNQYGTLANRDANEVSFTFNEDDNNGEGNDTFSASFRLHADDLQGGEDKGGILIDFGDLQPPSEPGQRRSFIHPDSGGLAALNQPDGITVYRDGDQPATLVPGRQNIAALASHEFFSSPQVNSVTGPQVQSFEAGPRGDIPSDVNFDVPEELCTDCDFMRWGVFAANVKFQDTNDQDQDVNRNAQVLGFWVAGDIAAVGDLPFTGTATYSGTAVGTVHTDLFAEGTYTARGDMEMSWNFARRDGNMAINKFDREHFEASNGLNFKGKMCAPGVTTCGTSDKPWSTSKGNHFGGPLNQKLPEGPDAAQLPEGARDINGFAVGFFARGPDNYDNGNPKTGTPVKGSTPQGVMGNWQVGNDHYQASGVFAGKRN